MRVPDASDWIWCMPKEKEKRKPEPLSIEDICKQLFLLPF